MAGNILSPSAIWNDFVISETPKAEVICETKNGEVSFSQLYVDGKQIDGETVKIFGVLAKPINLTKGPAILLVDDFNVGDNAKFISALVSRGYSVLSIDLAGFDDGKEHFTKYPEKITYANYKNAKTDLYGVSDSVKETCWYEWACAVKYAQKYLAQMPSVTSVGLIGVGEAGTVAWQVAGSDDNSFKCASFILNAGWIGYRGIHKFGGMVEPQFSDNMYKFIAGIEPQSYATHVCCPTLILSATNSRAFDCDRAFDTASRMESAPYKAVHYSIGERNCVNGEAFRTLLLFLEKYLIAGGTSKKLLPSEIDIKCDLVDGKVVVEVAPSGDEVKSVDLYVSEETCIPSERAWKKISIGKKSECGVVFEYAPYPESGMVTLFAQVSYKNGYTISSKIINKKFESNQVLYANKSKILYSSRYANAESVFSVATEKENVCVSEKSRIKVRKGPMSIEGVYSEHGLLTFKYNTKKDLPIEGAILMFDAYMEEAGIFTVKLISDYYGQKTTYIANVKLYGGDIWQNVKLDMSRFKTAEGMALKDYSVINAVEFSADGEFLLNNALWV